MSENTESTSPQFDISSLVSTLLSNPDTISKLGDILSKFAPNENGANSPLNSNFDNENNKNDESFENLASNDAISSPTEQETSNPNLNLDFSKISSILSGIALPQKHKINNQIALLLAIKPYLSPRRKELIDSFIKISNFGEIFKSINQQGGTNVLQ